MSLISIADSNCPALPPNQSNTDGDIQGEIKDTDTKHVKSKKLKHLILPKHARHSATKMKTMKSKHSTVGE